VYAFNHGTANNGNVASVTNNRDTARSLSYTYDELNRIDLAYTQATSGASCWGLDHGYDVWGNLLSVAKKTDTHNACAPTTLGVLVNTKNQISDTGFVYDAAGNLTNTPNPGGLTMVYDAENRMTSAAGVTYTYDGDGKRAMKSTAGTPPQPFKLYWYGTSSDPLFETDAAGTVTDEYIFFGGKRTARKKSSGEINYYFADYLGSSRVVTSDTGSILDDSDFYPFGKEVPFASAADNPYLFTGKERDTETGLDFFIARYYSSAYGRYMTPDWADAPAAVPYADFGNPQSLNLYTYVGNNPTKESDVDGHCWPNCSIALWSARRIAQDGGVRPFAKNIAIGTAKGTGSFLLSTARTADAALSGGGNSARFMQHMVSNNLQPQPRILTPSNETQAQVSAGTQITLAVAAVVVPLAKGPGAGTNMSQI
jgi:RHS repeat-associated protein